MVCRERYPDVNPQTQNFSKNKGLFSAKGSRAAIDSTPIKGIATTAMVGDPFTPRRTRDTLVRIVRDPLSNFARPCRFV